MPAIIEESLRFEFPDDWDASKFDEWSFYRGQFARFGNAEIRCSRKGCDGIVQCPVCESKRLAGTRGIDILAVGPDSICWFIEVKDYRLTREKDFAYLADTVALKVRDTLACLATARLNAPVDSERHRASRALACDRMQVLLHLEMPPLHSRLLNPTTQRVNVLQRLKQLVKSIDSRPQVVSRADMSRLPWRVTEV